MCIWCVGLYIHICLVCERLFASTKAKFSFKSCIQQISMSLNCSQDNCFCLLSSGKTFYSENYKKKKKKNPVLLWCNVNYHESKNKNKCNEWRSSTLFKFFLKATQRNLSTWCCFKYQSTSVLLGIRSEKDLCQRWPSSLVTSELETVLYIELKWVTGTKNTDSPRE